MGQKACHCTPAQWWSKTVNLCSYKSIEQCWPPSILPGLTRLWSLAYDMLFLPRLASINVFTRTSLYNVGQHANKGRFKITRINLKHFIEWLVLIFRFIPISFHWKVTFVFILNLTRNMSITGLPLWLSGKESTCNEVQLRPRFNSWLGKIPWRREGHLLQYSGLENSMDW